MIKLLFKTGIIILTIIGIITVLRNTMFKDAVDEFLTPTREQCIKKAEKMYDLSGTDKEFEFVRVGKVPFVGEYILINHKASDQKTLILKPTTKDLPTKKDFEQKTAEKKITDYLNKFQYQFVRIENFTVTGRGSLKILGQKAPFIKFDADAVNLPVKGLEGMIIAAETKDKESTLIITVNDAEKYSNIITNAIIYKIKQKK